MKKLWYYIPFFVCFLFYGFLFLVLGPPLSDFRTPMIFTLLLYLSSLLLGAGRWYGCLPGIGVGSWLLWTGGGYHGQLVDEWTIGIVFCLYYLICGILCTRSAKK